MDWGVQSTGAHSHTPTPWLEEEWRRQGRHAEWTRSISQHSGEGAGGKDWESGDDIHTAVCDTGCWWEAAV